MTKQRLFLDVHAIQVLPPSNVNRDDTGSPKTAQFGGVTRARVSSQAWKRAMRQYFSEHSDVSLGVRTKHIVDYIAGLIVKADSSISPEEAQKKAVGAVNLAGIKLDKDNNAKALFFLGRKQAEEVAKAAIAGDLTKEKAKELLKSHPDVDIALFGRMVADDPSMNEDASAQVAHAISTHAINTEYDYFTAIDDENPEDQAGAGMIGTVEFDSSTLYRYANISVHELLRQLEGDISETGEACKLFVEAFAKSMPSGKINTFANTTLPVALMVNLRSDRPVSLVSAYEKPVVSQKGYTDESVKRLFEELTKSEAFVDKPILTLYISPDEVAEATEGKRESNLNDLLAELGQKIEESL